MRLFRFITSEKKNLEAFQKWYEAENNQDPDQFPLDLPEEDWYDEYEQWFTDGGEEK